MSQPLPSISILIPTLNEEHFIDGCISSLINGNYPKELIEILVIDGGSTDQTIQRVEQLSNIGNPIKLIHNTKKIVPAALNLGLSIAKNDFIIWVGAHAIYHDNYLTNSVQTLIDEDCASVGGVISPIAKTTTGKAIAIATSSKFGIGNAKYRYTKSKQSVDTVFGGCWKKQDVIKVGGFNESWVRNQDYEFNFRLRSQIGKIILNPDIKCKYYCRERISLLAVQYFNYGFWRFQTFKQHPSTFTLRQAAPILLLFGLLISLIFLINGLCIGLLIPFIYITANLLSSTYLSIKKNHPLLIILLPIIFATLHLTWASGFTKGAIQDVISRIAFS